MYLYLKIWPMVIIVALGILAFILSALFSNKIAPRAIYIVVLIYSIVSVLMVSMYTELGYGFQNYLFVPIQLCFAFIYKESNMKMVLKYITTTFFVSIVAYLASILICFYKAPVTGANIEFILSVNVINAFLVFVLNTVVLVFLLVELFNESNALNKANKNLESYADRDPLTNLYNRRFAERTLNKLATDGKSFIIAICDIDHFKEVNDTYGHAAGDLVLQHASKVILSNINYSDYAIRWGGEEFLLIIFNDEASTACNVLNRVNLKLKEGTCYFEDKAITVSITSGIANYIPGETDIEDVIKDADRRLYIGKNTGRNRCVSDG